VAPPAPLRLDPLSPVYLVHGPEDLLRAEALAAIAAAVLDAELADFNHDRFEGGACDLGTVVAAARTVPVLAAQRLVEVRAVDRCRPEALAPLADYLKDPSPTTVLVLEGTQVDLRRTPFPQVKRVGQVVACQPLYERDAVRWLETRARALGAPIAPEAARFLAAYAGTQLATLATELEKAAAYAGPGREIDLEAVSETAGGGRVHTVFELTDALGERRAAAALKCLGTLLEAGEPPLKVQGMIVRHFRLLWRAREALAAGPAELASALGVHPFVADKLKRQAPRHGEAELAQAFLRFARVDFDLKGGAVSARRTLEDEVLALCG
jgi:DNA polymerase-3 subunit delta